jgi:hypothetical protein
MACRKRAKVGEYQVERAEGLCGRRVYIGEGKGSHFRRRVNPRGEAGRSRERAYAAASTQGEVSRGLKQLAPGVRPFGRCQDVKRGDGCDTKECGLSVPRIRYTRNVRDGRGASREGDGAASDASERAGDGSAGQRPLL